MISKKRGKRVGCNTKKKSHNSKGGGGRKEGPTVKFGIMVRGCDESGIGEKNTEQRQGWVDLEKKGGKGERGVEVVSS